MNNTRKRLCKQDIYKNERIKFIENLELNIGLNNENRSVLLIDLENNHNLKNILKTNISNIKKIYKCGSWNYFIQKEEERNEIGLLKSIFKVEGYKIISSRKYIEKNGVKKQYSLLSFYKKGTLTYIE